jgi:hypothetical protein
LHQTRARAEAHGVPWYFHTLDIADLSSAQLDRLDKKNIPSAKTATRWPIQLQQMLLRYLQ